MCVCIVCVYVCIHVMRVVRLPHKLTYCFFPFSWVDPTHSGGGATKPDTGIIYIYIIIYRYIDRRRFLAEKRSSEPIQWNPRPSAEMSTSSPSQT